eukprot:gene18529-25035_t
MATLVTPEILDQAVFSMVSAPGTEPAQPPQILGESNKTPITPATNHSLWPLSLLRHIRRSPALFNVHSSVSNGTELRTGSTLTSLDIVRQQTPSSTKTKGNPAYSTQCPVHSPSMPDDSSSPQTPSTMSSLKVSPVVTPEGSPTTFRNQHFPPVESSPGSLKQTDSLSRLTSALRIGKEGRRGTTPKDSASSSPDSPKLLSPTPPASGNLFQSESMKVTGPALSPSPGSSMRRSTSGKLDVPEGATMSCPRSMYRKDFNWSQFEMKKRLYNKGSQGDVQQYIRECGYLTSLGYNYLPEGEAVRLILQPFLEGIGALHAKGLIHRDIKPENILMTAAQQVKIADFGFAIDSREELANSRLGTTDYIAPEILDCPVKERPDEFKNRKDIGYTNKVDCWCIGILAYEMLVGYPPFLSKNPNETWEAIKYKRVKYPDSMSQLAIDFIKKALDRDPQKRPSVEQMLRHEWIRKYSVMRRRVPMARAHSSECGNVATVDLGADGLQSRTERYPRTITDASMDYRTHLAPLSIGSPAATQSLCSSPSSSLSPKPPTFQKLLTGRRARAFTDSGRAEA